MAYKFPETLLSLIAHLKKLPGVGSRTAERFAFEFLSWSQGDLAGFAQTLAALREAMPLCSVCGCLTDRGRCPFCTSEKRDRSKLCILASARDVFSFEETASYHGMYHVIEHLLSPLDGRLVHTLRLDRLEKRLQENPIQEIILALDSSLEGDTTALFLKNHLAKDGLVLTRLAFGLPMGSALQHIDGGTLGCAMKGRQIF